MTIIEQNPFRVLGVFANSPKKDIVANKGKAQAFLKVGRAVEYPLDLNNILGPIERDLDMMNEAEAHLAIAKEQLKYAQFWFLKLTPIDDIAFNHLFAGDMAAAKEMWSKQENLSSLQNKLICYLIEGKTKYALTTAEKLYSKFGGEYIGKVDANSTLQMLGEALLHQFIDSLGTEIGMQKLLQYDLSENLRAYIGQQTVGPLVSQLSAEVEKSKKTDRKDAEARRKSGEGLMSCTKEPLAQLKRILGDDDTQYQMIADKVGLEILQCGIDYYNNTDDDDAAQNAMKLQAYAQSIVVGTMAKQRCEENVKILKKIIAELPPQEVRTEDRAIKAAMATFMKQPDEISYAVTLLNASKPHLQSIKQKLGNTNSYYLKISTQLVGNALHNVIEEVNEAQAPLAKLSELLSGVNPYLRSSLLSGSSLDIDEIRNKVKSTLRAAWNATLIMDTFDLEADFKTRYNTNRSTLKSLCEQMGISTYSSSSFGTRSTSSSTSSTSTYRPTTSSTTPRKSSTSSSSSSSSSGCYIATMAYGSYDHPQVLVLRHFRDAYLAQREWGRKFIKYYYKHSPNWVEKLKNYKTINKMIRHCLDGFVGFLKKYKNY